MKRENHYFQWGLTAVGVVCAIMLIYDVVFRKSMLLQYVGKLLVILAPVLYGFAMAYLLAPLVNWFEKFLFRCEDRRGGKFRRGRKWIRGGAILLTWLVVLLFLYALLRVLLPELYRSVPVSYTHLTLPTTERV